MASNAQRSARAAGCGRHGLFLRRGRQAARRGTIVRDPALAAYLSASPRRRRTPSTRRRRRKRSPTRSTRADAQPVEDDRRRPRRLPGEGCARRSAEPTARYRICGMGPPSSGGHRRADDPEAARALRPGALGRNSPVAWHLFAESERLAYADRDTLSRRPRLRVGARSRGCSIPPISPGARR